MIFPIVKYPMGAKTLGLVIPTSSRRHLLNKWPPELIGFTKPNVFAPILYFLFYIARKRCDQAQHPVTKSMCQWMGQWMFNRTNDHLMQKLGYQNGNQIFGQ